VCKLVISSMPRNDIEFDEYVECSDSIRTPGESLLAEVLTTEGSGRVSEVIVGSSFIESLGEKPRCIRCYVLNFLQYCNNLYRYNRSQYGLGIILTAE
jgi:hypothetical protein